DRIVDEGDVAFRMAGQPKTVAHRIHHKDEKDQDVRRNEDHSPFLPWGKPLLHRVGRRPLDVGKGDGSHVSGFLFSCATAGLARWHPPQSSAVRRRDQPATCLIRAIISSVAFSGIHPSFTTRLLALAHTFSLLRT